MAAEKHLADALASQKTGRSAFNAQAFEQLTALALEFGLGKRSLRSDFRNQLQQRLFVIRKARK